MPLAKTHFFELEEAMKYAKWVRPFALLTLITAIELLIVQFHHISLLIPDL